MYEIGSASLVHMTLILVLQWKQTENKKLWRGQLDVTLATPIILRTDLANKDVR